MYPTYKELAGMIRQVAGIVAKYRRKNKNENNKPKKHWIKGKYGFGPHHFDDALRAFEEDR